MVDIPIACSSSMGASSTGGILLVGCLSLLGWCYLSAVALGCLSAAAFLWAGTRLRCVAASHRRFGRCEPAVEPFCQVVRCAIRRSSGPRRAGKTNPSGLGRARERSEESSRGNLFPAQRQIAAAERRRRASSAPRLPVVEGHRGATGSRRNRPKRFGQLFSVRGATDSGIN